MTLKQRRNIDKKNDYFITYNENIFFLLKKIKKKSFGQL